MLVKKLLWDNLACVLFLITHNIEDKNWVMNAKLYHMSASLAILFKKMQSLAFILIFSLYEKESETLWNSLFRVI